ncbi:hypothetical protein VNO77_23249 [Canavalia gladiata]|uniref:Uncharacterized protein n=1 Tax=Canavalia gladiata TaxID=3824 RepID=A0AAN9QF72_CANGL
MQRGEIRSVRSQVLEGAKKGGIEVNFCVVDFDGKGRCGEEKVKGRVKMEEDEGPREACGIRIMITSALSNESWRK